eukprot:1195221-Prorocentrum_minimum.AAC.9
MAALVREACINALRSQGDPTATWHYPLSSTKRIRPKPPLASMPGRPIPIVYAVVVIYRIVIACFTGVQS